MQRHERAEVRYQRERYKTRRRHRLSRWVGGTDWWAITRNLPPRPLDERLAEFWNPSRVGKLAKWNGSCNCWMCSWKYNRARTKRAWQQLEA